MKSIDGSCREISRSPSRAASSSTANQILTFCALITQRQSLESAFSLKSGDFIHFHTFTGYVQILALEVNCVLPTLVVLLKSRFFLTYLDDGESRQRGRKQKESEANRLIPGNDQSLSWNSCSVWNRRATFFLVHSQLSSHWTFF